MKQKLQRCIPCFICAITFGILLFACLAISDIAATAVHQNRSEKSSWSAGSLDIHNLSLVFGQNVDKEEIHIELEAGIVHTACLIDNHVHSLIPTGKKQAESVILRIDFPATGNGLHDMEIEWLSCQDQGLNEFSALDDVEIYLKVGHENCFIRCDKARILQDGLHLTGSVNATGCVSFTGADEADIHFFPSQIQINSQNMHYIISG